jgi:hypothetical protein
MRAQDLLGKTVVGVRRILYVYQGAVTKDEGALELSFHDGSTALFDTAENGNMQVTSQPWVDPFAPPLSPENVAYVHRYGKWTAFDLTSEPPANAVIGRQVSAYEELVTDEEALADYQCLLGQCLAASIALGDVLVRVLNWGMDEIHVEWQGATPPYPFSHSWDRAAGQ